MDNFFQKKKRILFIDSIILPKMKTNFIISDITYQRIINLHNVEHIHVY